VPYITIATEDELSEAVGNRLVADILPTFEVSQMLRRGGNGYLKKKCRNFNQMALRHPVLLITDLDNAPCASELINGWFGDLPLNADLIFRVAVREIESWLLADHQGMAELLERGANNITQNPDQLGNPKEYLLQCAKRASREVKNDLIRSKGALASQGLGYNSRLGMFVREVWAPNRASERSDSLARAMQRLREIQQ
jgi:hypothetical protein